MRILFDAYWWDSGPPANRAVQREMILAWLRAFPADSVAVAVRRDAPALDLPASVVRFNTHLWPHALTNLVELSRIGAKWQADAVIANNFTPLRGNAITYVHDAVYLDKPKWYSWRQRMYFRLILSSARFASVVTTGTQSEADRIERHAWHLAPVTSLGIAPFLPLTSAEPLRPSVSQGIEGFALTVGLPGGRGNVEAAVAAAAHSARITPRTPLIVVTGGKERTLLKQLPHAMKSLRDDGRVRFAGHIDNAGMSWLHRHAAVTLALAHDDNFGIPALEAVWFDAPLLASDLPVHREMADGWARFVPTGATPQQIGAAIDELWNVPGDEQARSRILAKRSWRSAARSLKTTASSR